MSMVFDGGCSCGSSGISFRPHTESTQDYLWLEGLHVQA